MPSFKLESVVLSDIIEGRETYVYGAYQSSLFKILKVWLINKINPRQITTFLWFDEFILSKESVQLLNGGKLLAVMNVPEVDIAGGCSFTFKIPEGCMSLTIV